jgi:hypothetical protein
MLWSEKVTNFQGLPRPYWFPHPKYYFFNGKKYLHKKVPVPFQSRPGTEKTSPITLNIKNEKKAVEEGLCSFCGVKIKDDELSIRWIVEKQKFPSDRDWVPTDFHPLHLECMKQTRVFCPFMRTLNDSQFEISIHSKNFKKYYTIDWEARPRPFEKNIG